MKQGDAVIVFLPAEAREVAAALPSVAIASDEIRRHQ